MAARGRLLAYLMCSVLSDAVVARTYVLYRVTLAENSPVTSRPTWLAVVRRPPARSEWAGVEFLHLPIEIGEPMLVEIPRDTYSLGHVGFTVDTSDYLGDLLYQNDALDVSLREDTYQRICTINEGLVSAGVILPHLAEGKVDHLSDACGADPWSSGQRPNPPLRRTSLVGH